MFKILLIPIAFAATAASAEPLSKYTVRTQEVRISDLDLSTMSDHAKLQRRIDGAVWRVCNRPESRTLSERADAARCEKEARTTIAEAVERKIALHKERKRMAQSAAPIVAGN